MSKDSDNIQVIIRVRPLNKRELEEVDEPKRCLSVDQQKRLRLDDIKTGSREFEFDWIGDETTTQKHIFESIGKSMVDRCLKGYNCCIFAYGQTGAGKTYTMQGKDLKDCSIDDSDRGLQPRVFDYMFDMMSKEMKKTPGTIFTLSCSYLEIYNEQIMDLLNPKNTNLRLREEKEVPFVDSLEQFPVTDPASTIDLLRRGAYNRHVSATKMNSESSRSHSIFTMTIECQTIYEKLVTTRKSKFHFVDLAGSERQSQTNSVGERLREAGNINKSLSVLGQVIKSIMESVQGKKGSYIRYRDSKLTYLLKDSLGGNSKTALIANISPSSGSFQETLSTLHFASNAKEIKNTALINEGVTGNIEDLKNELKKLKESENSVNQLKLEHSEKVEQLMLEISGLQQREIEAINLANLEIQKREELQREFEEIRRNEGQSFNDRLQEMQQEVSRLQDMGRQSTKELEQIGSEMNELRKKEMESFRKSNEESKKYIALQAQIEENRRVNDLEISNKAKQVDSLSANHAKLEKIVSDLRCENARLKEQANKTDDLYRRECEKNQNRENNLPETLQNNILNKSENEKLIKQNGPLELMLLFSEFDELKKRNAFCADKDTKVPELQTNNVEILKLVAENNFELPTETISYENSLGADLKEEDSDELSRVEEPILSRNQHFDNWQKKIDTVFRTVLRAENFDGENTKFEEGEQVDYEDAINVLEELEEMFYEREEELKSLLKIPRRDGEGPQVRRRRVPSNQIYYREADPTLVKDIKQQHRIKVNQLKVELEKEEQRKVNVKEILVKVFEHSKKVNQVYEQEIQELTKKLNDSRTKEKSNRDEQVRVKWFEKQLEEKTGKIKEYEDIVAQMQSKLEKSAEKEELERLKEQNLKLVEKIKTLKSKDRENRAEIKKRLEKAVSEMHRKSETLNKIKEIAKRWTEANEVFAKNVEQEFLLMPQNNEAIGLKSVNDVRNKENMPSDEKQAGIRENKTLAMGTNCGKRTLEKLQSTQLGAESEFDFKIKKVKYN